MGHFGAGALGPALVEVGGAVIAADNGALPGAVAVGIGPGGCKKVGETGISDMRERLNLGLYFSGKSALVLWKDSSWCSTEHIHLALVPSGFMRDPRCHIVEPLKLLTSCVPNDLLQQRTDFVIAAPCARPGTLST